MIIGPIGVMFFVSMVFVVYGIVWGGCPGAQCEDCEGAGSHEQQHECYSDKKECDKCRGSGRVVITEKERPYKREGEK